MLDALSRSANAELAGVAAKALKEAKYHVRHSGEWVVKLGDGTDESHRRAQRALDELWRFTGELFVARRRRRRGSRRRGSDPICPRSGRAGRRSCATWSPRDADAAARRRALAAPRAAGRHAHEHLGHMLAEMQIVARSHPGATW